MQKKNIIVWVLIVIFLAYGFKTVSPKYSFANDSLIKLLQAKSLLNNKYTSDDYSYFFKKYDPNFTFFPIDYHLYHLKVGNKHIGPFGVMFSFFASLFLWILPYQFLPLISGLLFILILVILKKLWNLNLYIVLYLAFCTSLIIYTLEFSENLLFIFLHFLSFTLFFKWKKQILPAILSGALLGISVGLRLETVLFFPFFGLGYLLINKFQKWKDIILFSISFTIVFILFLGFNFVAYGHILGPKFIADEGNFFLGFSHKLLNYISLYFGKNETAFFKVGFFGLTPIFFFAGIWCIKSFKDLGYELKILFISTGLYVLIAPAFAPHDGQWSWGARYLSICVIPFGLFLDKFWKDVIEEEKKKWMYVVFIVVGIYSFAQTMLGVKIIGMSSSIMKTVQKNTERIDSDIRLFHSGIFALHTGPQVLDTPSILASDKEKLINLIAILKKDFKGKKLSYIYSEKLDYLLKGGGVPLNANSKEYRDVLSSEFKEIKSSDIINPEMEIYFYEIQ